MRDGSCCCFTAARETLSQAPRLPRNTATTILVEKSTGGAGRCTIVGPACSVHSRSHACASRMATVRLLVMNDCDSGPEKVSNGTPSPACGTNAVEGDFVVSPVLAVPPPPQPATDNAMQAYSRLESSR